MDGLPIEAAVWRAEYQGATQPGQFAQGKTVETDPARIAAFFSRN